MVFLIQFYFPGIGHLMHGVDALFFYSHCGHAALSEEQIREIDSGSAPVYHQWKRRQI